MSRLLAYGFGLGVVALTASPIARHPDDDSYPLSTYPMFARARGKPWLSVVEGVDAQGAAVRLRPELVGSDEVMQAAATVRRAVRGGPGPSAELCGRVAARVASDAETRAVREVRVVTARFDPLRYFSEGPEPEAREVHHVCAVPRSP